MSDVQVRSIDWLWTGWIPRKYITLVVGESGAGKSTVLADIVARITTGEPWPGETERRTPGRVLWLGSEDGAEDMTVPRLMACNADLPRVIEIQGVQQV
jgi:RecA-family ATPase